MAFDRRSPGPTAKVSAATMLMIPITARSSNKLNPLPVDGDAVCNGEIMGGRVKIDI